MIKLIILIAIIFINGCAYLSCTEFSGDAKDVKAQVKGVPGELGKGGLTVRRCMECYFLRAYKKIDDIKFGEVVPLDIQLPKK